MREESRSKDYIWQERKRLWCGLPWTFTTYAMSKDRMFVKTGLLTTHEYEVRLYRIVNVSISRTLIQRMFGLCIRQGGTVRDGRKRENEKQGVGKRADGRRR